MPDVIIPGATTNSRMLVAGDVGKMLFCKVKATNVAGFAFADSNELGPITGSGVPAAPSILTAPNIGDLTPQTGETLHTTDGTWGGYPPPTFAYQWHRVTVSTPAAPVNTGAPSIADTDPQVGETLHTTDGTWSGEPAPTFGYQWHRVTPDAVLPSGGTPSITDTTPFQGETLHCDHGIWAGDTPITYAYQWKRGVTNVGTDSADYLLGPDDVTFNMSCVVTASNVAGSSAPATSNVVGPVSTVALPPSNIAIPNIADITPQIDETLHTTDGTWTGAPAPTLSYQWYQVGTAAVITSSAMASNVENTVLAHALTADQSVTWSLWHSSDISQFEISGSTLRWGFNGTRDREAPADANDDNDYIAVVRATNATGQTTEQTVTVTVTDVVAEPTLTLDFTGNTAAITGGTGGATATGQLTVTRAGTIFYAETVAGTWTGFAANLPRRTDKGLLIEEARTNVVLQNRTQTNASWVKTTCTATKNQVGIDGVANSCCSLTATAGNATCLVTLTLTSSARFQTAFIKRLVGTGVIEMTMNGGTTWVAVVPTASWARYSIPTQTLANPVVGFRIVTSGDSIAVDFVQNENGIYATSPIPTTTASVTRAADVVILNTAVAPLSGWFNVTAGTLYAEGDAYTGTLPSSTAFQIDSGAATNLHYVGLPGSAAAAAGGTTTASTVVGTFTGTKTAGVNKSAWAYAANDMAGSFNGGAVVTDATGAMPAGLTTVRFGKLVAATMWSGYLRKVTYYNGRLSNAELVTLTTP